MSRPSEIDDPLAYYAYKLGEAEQEIKQLCMEIGRLRSAFRANMLRYAPIGPETQAEIDRVLTEAGIKTTEGTDG